MTEKVVAIIPARMESSRLPDKPMVDILGLPMIVHVFKRCELAKYLDGVYVATDSLKIKNVVEKHGGNVIMTSKHHQTGTDRIAEAAKNINADIIVNVQGDEALVNPDHIDDAVCKILSSKDIQISLLVNPFSKRNSPSDIKVVLNEFDEIMYLSREDIPSNSREKNSSMLKAYHIVPFRKDFLMQYSKWKKTKLESIESNEYLRILEKGFKIHAVHVESNAISVDTYDDLLFVRNLMKTDKIVKKYL